MLEALFKIWFMIAILPFIIFLEASKAFAGYLKKKNIYTHWDVWHSLLVVLVAFLIILLLTGYY